MVKLTKTEEQIMQLLWEHGKTTVSKLIEQMPSPKPPHSTISSVIRILEKKQFVNHETYGRTHAYFPIVSKDKYSRNTLSDMIKSYFDGSVENMVSFLVKEKNIETDELKKLVEELENKAS